MTARQYVVVRMYLKGYSTRSISEQLNITCDAVRALWRSYRIADANKRRAKRCR